MTDWFPLRESHRLFPDQSVPGGTQGREGSREIEDEESEMVVEAAPLNSKGQLCDGHESCWSYSPLNMNILYWLD